MPRKKTAMKAIANTAISVVLAVVGALDERLPQLTGIARSAEEL
jgi:hypothetical protein